ncbi:MAG TPA: ABC transporter substrate-binding protein [Chloroflexota bacterium]|nr:ABC transporter substrate-binding protein [Chloroflexota bacterium]
MRSFRFLPLSLALLLAACGGAAAPSAAPASQASAAPASAKPAGPASAAASAPAKPAASGSAAAKPAAGGDIKVGLLEPLTGSFASTAKDNQDGFNLYLETVSSTAAGRKIQAIYADTQGQAPTALTKAKQLVESDKVQALMGITPTPECYAVADYVKTAHVPLIVSANCSAEDLMTNPQHKSPYTVRFTQTNLGVADPGADWAYKNGLRKAILFTSDYGGGLEQSDAFAAAFISRGGSIVQELHPALGAPDFGPLLAQLDPSADSIWTFLPGADGLHFGLQYGDYSQGRKTQVLEAFADISAGPNLTQLKDKAVGLIASNVWSEAYDAPANKEFIKAFQAKYPGRLLSKDVVQGYVGAQILEEAVKKVNGNIEDADQFMQALYSLQLDTAKGPVHLDANHDIVQSYYIYQTVKQGDGFGQKLLDTYKDVSAAGKFTPEQHEKLKIGTHKGQWVGMTKDKLAAMIG